MASFDSLVRFKDEEGNVHYGEAGHGFHTKENLIGRSVQIFSPEEPWKDGFTLLQEQRKIVEVLSPLARTPIFMCIGLNYKQHADEANIPYGEYPTVFTKPADALAGPFDQIPVHPECSLMDYEAELCVIIGADCKNFTDESNLADYVLGYTCGNDVSSRFWQMPARSGNQHGSAKSFDKFAPLGPVITSQRLIPDPKVLKMTCKVNGELRQSTSTDDLIFDIPTLLKHLSRGTTLRRGTVIMTGTPSGVAAFMKPPPWLKNGDIVEVGIDQIGSTKNTMSI